VRDDVLDDAITVVERHHAREREPLLADHLVGELERQR
jgi:hypothetical protein